jgi:rod shape determining protein RodA
MATSLPHRWRPPALDYQLLFAALALSAMGLLMVYSATSIPGSAHEGYWIRQLVWLGLGVLAAVLTAGLPYRVYDTLAWVFYGLSLALLLGVLVAGSTAYGARRWLDLGPVRFQPSELAKIATVMVLARRFDDRRLDLSRVRYWGPAALIALVPTVVVLKEPDLGTALAFPVILVAMYFWAGMRPAALLLGLSPAVCIVLYFATGSPWWFALVLLPLLVWARPRAPMLVAVVVLNLAVSVSLPHLWNSLHDYQQRRITTFLNPEQDPRGAGYQIIQSKIAIGSGGLRGKGFLKGTQKGLAFLPMRHTDFVFAVVGEELGFAGALTAVLLFALIVFRGFTLAAAAHNPFAGLLAVGVTSALFYHVIVNLLMTIGWAPVTGLPLPFVSYGGTALVANCIQIGLLQNVALRRQER